MITTLSVSAFLSSPAAVAALGALVGFVPFGISLVKRKANEIPALAEVKEAYPIINVVLKAASDRTEDHSIVGIIADAAYLFWSDNPSIDDERAKALTAATVKHFSKEKYQTTIFSRLQSADVQRGHELAKLLGFE